MSGVRPTPKPSAASAKFRVALLAAGTAICVGLVPVLAQETGSLRGAVGEVKVNNDLLSRKTLADRRSALDPAPTAEDDTGIPSEPYSPSTAVADEDAVPDPAASLFDDPKADESAFGEPIEPTPTKRPTTARQRSEEARKAAMAGPAKAADPKDPETEPDADETTTGTVRAGTVDSENDLTVDPGAAPEAPIEGIDREAETDPFAPVGLTVGTFILRPSLESGVTYTTNADSSSTGTPAFQSETTLRLNATSEWSRHSATIDAYGTFRKTISGAPLQETEAGIDAELQLELGNEFRATVEAGYARQPETVDSPVVIVGAVSQPLQQTLNGSLGLAKDVGKARFSITGKAEREWYGDAELASGGVISQTERNFTLATVALRGGYEISPAFTPFAEVEYGRRMMDVVVDANGFERSSNRMAARAGVAFDFGEKLSGELSGGWVRETLDDASLAPISGATVAANVFWSPLRDTTIAFNAATTVEGTTTPDESGSLLYTADVSLERRLRANLTGAVTLGAEWRQYVGSTDHDTTLSAEGSMTWWLNRYAGLTTRVRHETAMSTLPDGDYQTNSVFLGLKLQR